LFAGYLVLIINKHRAAHANNLAISKKPGGDCSQTRCHWKRRLRSPVERMNTLVKRSSAQSMATWSPRLIIKGTWLLRSGKRPKCHS